MSLVQVKGSVWDSDENILVNLISDLGSVLEQKDLIVTKGHSNVSDGGGGSFIFDALVARNTADGGTIIDPTGSGIGNGCWLRKYTTAQFSLTFFGSDDSSTNNLLSAYGVDEATVNISSGNGGVFIFDSTEVGNDDQINNFNGWIRVGDHHIRNDLEAITGIIKLGDGVYEDGKSYLLPSHYLIDLDELAYIPAKNVGLPYSVDTGTYPTAEDDPNLITFGGSFSDTLQEEQQTLVDSQLTILFSLPIEFSNFYIEGVGRLSQLQYFKNIGTNEIDLVESYPNGTVVTLVLNT